MPGSTQKNSFPGKRRFARGATGATALCLSLAGTRTRGEASFLRVAMRRVEQVLVEEGGSRRLKESPVRLLREAFNRTKAVGSR